jgi:hypothetical protein
VAWKAIGRRVIGHYKAVLILGVMPCMVMLSFGNWLKEDYKWPPSNAFNRLPLQTAVAV